MSNIANMKTAQNALLFGTLGNALGAAFLFAALPLLGRKLGLTDIQTGALLGLGSLGLLIAAPIWGWLVEKMGRRPVLLTGLLSATLAPLAVGGVALFGIKLHLTATSLFALLLTVRLLQTLLGGGLLPAAQAFMADCSTPDRRSEAMGLLGASFGIGGILGAAVLWKVAAGNVFMGFWLVSGVSLMAFIAAFFRLSESKTLPIRQIPDSVATNTRALAIGPFLTITFLGVATFAALKQIIGLRLQDDFGFSFDGALTKTGFVLTISAMFMVFSQLFVIRFLRLTLWRFILLASLLNFCALLLTALTNSYVVFVGAMLLMGCAQGMLLPTNLGLLSITVGEASQGKAAGINAMFQGLGMVLGPMLGASLFGFSSTLPYWLFAPFYLLLAAYAFYRCLPLTIQRNKADTAQGGFAEDAAARYDERIDQLVPGYRAQQVASVSVLKAHLPGAARVLVVGAGTGNELVELATANPQWRFVAIDPSRSMLVRARKRVELENLSERVELKVCALADYRGSERFDAAVSHLVMHFIADTGEKARFLEAIAHHLKPGALLLSFDYTSDTSPLDTLNESYWCWAEVVGKNQQQRTEMRLRLSNNFHPVDNQRLQVLMQEAGFGTVIRYFQSLNFCAYMALRSSDRMTE